MFVVRANLVPGLFYFKRVCFSATQHSPLASSPERSASLASTKKGCRLQVVLLRRVLQRCPGAIQGLGSCVLSFARDISPPHRFDAVWTIALSYLLAPLTARSRSSAGSRRDSAKASALARSFYLHHLRSASGQYASNLLQRLATGRQMPPAPLRRQGWRVWLNLAPAGACKHSRDEFLAQAKSVEDHDQRPAAVGPGAGVQHGLVRMAPTATRVTLKVRDTLGQGQVGLTLNGDRLQGSPAGRQRGPRGGVGRQPAVLPWIARSSAVRHPREPPWAVA